MRSSPRSPSVGGIPRTSSILDRNSPPPTTTSTGTSSPIRPPFLLCDQQPPPRLQNRKSVTPSPLKDNDPLPIRCRTRSTPPLQTAEGKEAAHDSSMPLSIDRSQMKPSPINHRQTKRKRSTEPPGSFTEEGTWTALRSREDLYSSLSPPPPLLDT